MGNRIEQKKSSVYVLSVRTVLLVLVVVLAVGAIGGGGAAWFVIKDTLDRLSTEPRVIERVEMRNGANIATIREVSEDVRRTVAGVLDREGNVIQMATILTADGIAVTPMRAAVPRPPNVMLSDGSTVSSAIVREYPDIGLLFLRISGEFPTPDIAIDFRDPVGIPVVLIGIGQNGMPGMLSVRESVIERMLIPSGGQLPAGVSLAAELPGEFDTRYMGAPVYGYDRRVMGIVDPTGSVFIPASIIDAALQDIFHYPDKAAPDIFVQIEGEWEIYETALAFRVDAISRGTVLAQSGILAGDRIVSIREEILAEPGMLWRVLLEAVRAGETVLLSVERAGERVAVTVEPPEPEDE